MGALARIGQYLAQRFTGPNTGFSYNRTWFPGREEMGGYRVTPDEALKLSAVWACATVIAKSLASCKWDVFLERANGDREPRRNLATYSLLNTRPNPETSAYAFKEAMYIQAAVWGDFFAEIQTGVGGQPVALWPLLPERCCLMRDPVTQRLVLEVRNQGGGTAVLDYDNVFHVHGPGVDGITGYSPVTMAARSLAHAAAAEAFGHSFYNNGTQLGGVLSTDQKLSKDARDATRTTIEGRLKGSKNAFGLLLLDNNFKYQSIGVDPDKAQFIESRFFLIEEVCRWFGVPPHKIAHLLRSTFANIEHQSIEFVRDALTPWAERAAQEVNYKLLRPWPGINSRVDLDWLAEGDAKAKAEVDSIEVNNGLATRNEVRRRRGRNGLGPEGDALTVQVNLTLLEKVGEDPQVAPPQAPGAPPEKADPSAQFRSAVSKAMKRRARVARDLAAVAVSTDAFRLALAEDDAEHARYTGHLVASVVERLGGTIDPAAVAAVVSQYMGAETATYVQAFDSMRAVEDAVWRETAADPVAAKLAALISG